jgi:outer membrane immunogenic protein
MLKLSTLAAGSAMLTAAVLGGASAALADGYAPKKVAYERPADWSGVYFGLHSGYAFSDTDHVYTAFGTRYGNSPDASIVGGHIGIQHQFGQFVVGIEGNWTTAIRDEFDASFCPNPAFRCESRFDDVLTIGPRLGWAMGHWMPYLSGGYATARWEEERRSTATGALAFSGSERHSGWFIGGGFDMIVSPGWTFGLEYRHHEFDSALYGFHDPAGVAAPAEQTRGDPSLDTITLRTTWKWGRPDAVVAKPLK